jgi:hypothetical protein
MSHPCPCLVLSYHHMHTPTRDHGLFRFTLSSAVVYPSSKIGTGLATSLHLHRYYKRTM